MRASQCLARGHGERLLLRVIRLPQGPAELIRDDVNGRLMANDASPAEWADVVSTLADPERRGRLAEAALDVRDRFSEPRLRRCFMGGVSQLIGDD